MILTQHCLPLAQHQHPNTPHKATLEPRQRRGRRVHVCASMGKEREAAYLGMDFGTSGARATVIDGTHWLEMGGIKWGLVVRTLLPVLSERFSTHTI